jgi:hypothetical protein
MEVSGNFDYNKRRYFWSFKNIQALKNGGAVITITVPKTKVAIPTGTGFRHITAGVEDAAAKQVENADVSNTAAIAESKLALNYATHPPESTTTMGALINGATEKTTPVDADMVGLMDSAASNILKKLSWLNIKATLKTYFDTLYVAPGAAPLYLTPANPTNLTSTNYTMFGLGSTLKITPLKSGKVKFSISFFPSAVGIASAMNNYKLAYGSGAAPINGAAATGTVVGGVYTGGGAVAAASTPAPIVREIIVTGLTPGTQYWFDIQGQKASGYTSMGMATIESNITELPY